MKANELMIGDWVSLSKGNWSESRQVELIDIEMIAESVYFAEPIPLTAEILEQNGFEEKTESNPFVYYLFKDGDNSVSLEHTYDITDKEDYWACGIGNRLCDVCTISMHYIHELQHALRLCGITREIVL